MRIQNIEIGSAKNIIVRLHPKHAAMNPNVNEPHMAPMEFIAAIHDTSCDVNGPVTRGVSGEDNWEIAGAIQPRIQPKVEKILLMMILFIYTFCSKSYQLFSNRFQASRDFLKQKVRN